ncbi:MAG: hypothetical protein KJI72_00195 [Patescibacteria group bacterium]|nr:hypothetical protein [Patescibacteria group bacterium]
MNEKFKKLTEEIKQKLEVRFKSEEVQKSIAVIKEAEDTGTFEVIISTADVDRAGESIKQEGWELSFYKKNPIVLWAHGYDSLPIGLTESIEVRDGKLIAKGKFAPKEANPFAEQIRRLYDLKFIRTASVGFIPKEMEDNVITKAELLEWSFVPIPANPQAVSLLTAQKLDVAELVTKGIVIKEESGDQPPAKKKGEISDEVEAGDNLDEKFGKLDKVFDIINAFLDVYLQDTTPVGKFNDLLAETIKLLQKLIEGDVKDTDGEVEKSIKLAGSQRIHEMIRELYKKKDDKNNKISSKETIINQLEKIVVALRELPNAATPKGDASEEHPRSVDGIKKRPKDAGVGDGHEFNDFIFARELLRSFDEKLNDALERFNKKARERFELKK